MMMRGVVTRITGCEMHVEAQDGTVHVFTTAGPPHPALLGTLVELQTKPTTEAPVADPDEQADEDSEHVRVIAWRKLRLLDAGYAPQHACLLANRQGVDIEYAAQLIRHGCSEDIATDILV